MSKRKGINLAISAGAWTLPGLCLALPLNDTGLGENNYSTLQSNYYFERTQMQAFPGQDPQYGRDAAAAAGKLSKVGGGRRGFDFSGHHDCVKDNVTGLIWEVKTAASDAGPRSQKWTYSWYDERETAHPGRRDGGICHSEATEEKERIACDTQAYIQYLNEQALCGYQDWRLPHREELRSIVDYSQPNVNTLDIEHILPSIDQDYFPLTLSSGYWTGNRYLADKKRAWTVDFEHGGDSNREKTMGASIRLVSDAEKHRVTPEQRYSAYRSDDGQRVEDNHAAVMSDVSSAHSHSETNLDAHDNTRNDTDPERMSDASDTTEEPGMWDRMLGVFRDDEAVSDAEMETDIEAETEIETETMNPPVSDDTPSAEMDAEAEQEPGFFQKVKDLF